MLFDVILFYCNYFTVVFHHYKCSTCLPAHPLPPATGLISAVRADPRPPQGDDDFEVVPDSRLVVARTAFTPTPAPCNLSDPRPPHRGTTTLRWCRTAGWWWPARRSGITPPFTPSTVGARSSRPWPDCCARRASTSTTTAS